MPRTKDTNLTEVVHLRVSAKMKAFFKEEAEKSNLLDADIYRAALSLFMRRGGMGYAKDND